MHADYYAHIWRVNHVEKFVDESKQAALVEKAGIEKSLLCVPRLARESEILKKSYRGAQSKTLWTSSGKSTKEEKCRR